MAHEFERISKIAALHAGRALDPSIVHAIGDDCAIIDPTRLRAGERLVWTIDTAVDEIHFRRAWLSMEQLGYRATIAATSDLLAMGARPIAMLAASTLPDDLDDDAFDACVRGQRSACDAVGVALIGGNLSSGSLLSIATTALGATTRPILRSRASIGDVVVVAGVVGEAAIGLRALMSGREAEFARFADRWRVPPCLLAAADIFASHAHALIDVSDGLAQDVGHIARASGVRIVLDERALAARRAPDVDEACARLGVDALTMELSGGEDYALVATMSREAFDDGFAREYKPIGEVVAGTGVSVRTREGVLVAPPAGHVHGVSR